MNNKYDICIVGSGHIGSPLGILFASKGLKVLLYDINKEILDTIASGKLPFIENGYKPFLQKALKDNNLFFTTNSNEVKYSKNVIITIGTPVDEFGNSKIQEIINCIDDLPINNNQLIVLRSTVFPGTTEYVQRHLKSKNIEPLLSFAPERLIQGFAFKELQELPQIVSGCSQEAEDKVSELFQFIAPSIVRMKVMEAEFAKLFSNTYRYIQFAATNSFYKLAASAGLDYKKILDGLKKDYPRLRDLPSAGFAAGYCLGKDTAQIISYAQGDFPLGQSAAQINEGLPSFIISQLEKSHDLTTKTIGLLGMAFKKDNDDIRASLSYKLKKILKFKSKEVLTNDPLVPLSIDPTLLPLDEVINQSDILILCIPHTAYDGLDFKGKEVVNIWNG